MTKEQKEMPVDPKMESTYDKEVEKTKEKPKDKNKESTTSYTVPLVLGGLGLGGLALGLAMITPKASSALGKFRDLRDRIHGTNGVINPDEDLDTYIRSGSDAAGGKLFGVGVVPFMKQLRLSVLTPKPWRYWGDGVASHYTDFESGPLAAYFRYLDEHVDSEKYHNTAGEVLTPRPSILSSPIQFLKSIGRKDDAWTDRIHNLTGNRDIHVSQEGVNAIKDMASRIDAGGYDVANDTKLLKEKARELSSLLGYNADHFSKLTRSAQESIYDKLDTYVKNTDKNLYNKKQFTDMVQSIYRMPTSTHSYGTLADVLGTTQNTLLYGGGALAASGGALALYKYYRDKQEQEKRNKQEEESA